MKKRIVSLSPLSTEVLLMMVQGAGFSFPDDIEIIGGNQMGVSELLAVIRDADIILGDYTFNRKITREMVAAAKKVKLIQQPSVGYQNIDVEACTEAGIPVANTAGANTTGVAEHTIMAALCLLKNCCAAHRATAAGEWVQMEIGAGELQGKLWGLIGMGRIGRAVAERLIPFGVRMIYYDTARMKNEDEERYRASFSGIEDLLKTADMVSIHCPLTDETRGLVNDRYFALMKASAFVINVARGEIIDEEALARALNEKRLAGAACDVFSEEPITKENPLLGVGSARLLLTPHIAGATNESKIRIITAAVRNMVSVLNGGKPESVINDVE